MNLYVRSERYTVPKPPTTPPTTSAPVVEIQPPGAPIRPAALVAQPGVTPTPTGERRCDTKVRNTVTLRLETKVPKLIGLSVGGARDVLRRHGLQLQVDSPATHDKAVVRTQNPQEGAVIEIDAVPVAKTPVVVVTRVVVPDLVNAVESDACRELRDAQLECKLNPSGDGPPPGRVTAQAPPSGALVDPGTEVVLDVLRGQLPVTVPNVLRLTEDQACERLRAQKLECGPEGTPGGDLPSRVVDQNPAAGTEVPPQTKVTIVIDPFPVRVPRVLDLTADDGCRAIERAHLTCARTETRSGGTPGRVIRQNPAPDTLVPVGSDVIVAVVQGVPVPNVRGISKDDACATISGAGLSCRVDSSADTGAAANVVSQNPAAGTLVAEGTEVVLVVREQDAGVPPWVWLVGVALLLVVGAGAAARLSPTQPQSGGAPSVEVRVEVGEARVRTEKVW